MSGPHMGGAAAGRPPARSGGPGRGGPMGFAAMPVAKPKNFRGSFRRLLGELRPERRLVIAVMLLAIVSVTLAILGPKILGNATNLLFNGVVGKQLPAAMPMPALGWCRLRTKWSRSAPRARTRRPTCSRA